MVKERRLAGLVVVLLAAALSALPVTALAKPPDGVPPGCNRDGGGPGGGNENDPCLPTTTVPVTVPTTTTTIAATTTTTVAATTTTEPGATTTTTEPGATTTEPGATTTTTEPGATTTEPGATTTTTAPGATTTTTTTAGTTTTAAGGAASRPSDPGTPGAVVTLPAPAGLHGVDMHGMNSSLAGAVMIIAKSGDTAPGATDMPDTASGLSVSINRLLGPVAPPALVDAVASPLVVLEALVAAVTSSSQALIIPGIVLLVGFGIPGRRRGDDRRHRALTFDIPTQ